MSDATKTQRHKSVRRAVTTAGVCVVGACLLAQVPTAATPNVVNEPKVAQSTKKASPAISAPPVRTSAASDGTLPKTGLLVPSGVKDRPAMTAAAWLMFDVDTGDVLAAQNPRQFHPPASTIKTLTALTAMKKLELDTEYTATKEDAGIEGSKVGIIAGGKYTVRDLLHGLMLSSGNDAANALGNMFGSQDALVAAMNEHAKELGATETVVGTPSGLDAEGQRTTVVDMAIIARAALNDPELSKIAKTRLYTFPGKFDEEGNQGTFQVSNHNKIFRFKEGIGLKTGFTQKSRHTYMGAMQKDGRRLAVMVLRGETRPWRQSGKLMQWAFALPADTPAVGKLPAEVDLTTPTPTPTPEESSAAPSSDKTGDDAALTIPDSRPSSNIQWVIAGIAIALGIGIAALLRRHLMVSRRRKLYSVSSPRAASSSTKSGSGKSSRGQRGAAAGSASSKERSRPDNDDSDDDGGDSVGE